MQLGREDIAGAVVSVVKDGKLLFAKGYGYSDVAKKSPVIPEATLFRPGSISKLFTWTAVMQQVEQGKLDLDRDVNDYLDFKIPATYPQPITLRNLMTHTPGFEEAVKNLFADNANRLLPLGQYLGSHVPQRIFPPGSVPAYSNYGAALAGYIVQRVSGQRFDQYVEESIFKPLGMTRATFRQPLPDALKPLMSNGYALGSDPPKPFEVIEEAPAGALSVAAGDLARFMIAHLQDGQYNGASILRPETARLMHARQSGPNPALNGMALGFYEQSINGHRVISHGGDTAYFHSNLYLVLDASLGLFVSYNSAGKGEINPRTALYEQFMDRYFPNPSPPPAPLPTAAQDAKKVAGVYLCSRRSETTIFSVTSVFDQTKVSSNADGTISVGALQKFNGEPKHLREVAPMVFQDVDGSSRVAFNRGPGGRLVLAYDLPVFIFQAVPWYKNTYLHLTLFFGSFAIFALALIFWPLGAALRWHYGRPLALSPTERRTRVLARSVCLFGAAFVLSWIAYGAVAEKSLSAVSDSFDPWLRMMQLLGLLTVVGTLVALYSAQSAWRNRARWFWSKLGESAIVVACLGLTWFILTWHLLALSLNY
jgi:CubicO group peptidase (beta-lactamase class C family)